MTEGWLAAFGVTSPLPPLQPLQPQTDALKIARDAIRGLLDITSEYNLDSEQAGRAYGALCAIDAALKGKANDRL
jgi:hypothetical protein